MSHYRKLCPNIMILRFDSYQGRIARGRMQVLDYQTQVKFDSMDHLVLVMDKIMDELDIKRKNGMCRSDIYSYDFSRRKSSDLCRQMEFRGQITVMVSGREHRSMQGTLCCKGERKYFRSTLELMQILHEYLEGNLSIA